MARMPGIHVYEFVKKRGDKEYVGFQLRKREAIEYADKRTGKTVTAHRTAYVMYLGKEPIMSKSIARKLCEDHDEITMADLDGLVTRGKLKIVPDDQYQKPTRGRPKKQKEEVKGT